MAARQAVDKAKLAASTGDADVLSALLEARPSLATDVLGSPPGGGQAQHLDGQHTLLTLACGGYPVCGIRSGACPFDGRKITILLSNSDIERANAMFLPYVDIYSRLQQESKMVKFQQYPTGFPHAVQSYFFATFLLLFATFWPTSLLLQLDLSSTCRVEEGGRVPWLGGSRTGPAAKLPLC